jgi:hypothetical protein
MKRKIGRKSDRKMKRATREEPRTLDGLSRKDVENGLDITLSTVKAGDAEKEGVIVLTGLKLEAEDGSGRSLELARCLNKMGYGAFFVDHSVSRRSSRAYCETCQRHHRALKFIDAVRDGWPVLGEDNDCCLSPETLMSGVITLLRKKAAPAKAATS